MPTVNISSGCAHGCVYCYGRGYSQYPGEGAVLVYRDTAARVEEELARKRRRPAAVYFCPSCDAFQAVDAVLEESYRTMHVLLESGVGVEFVTKGAVPDRFLDLFGRHPGRVSAQIGLTTLADPLRAVLEPGAAPVAERLRSISRLEEVGVNVSVRADPLIYGVSDTDANVSALMTACRERGVTDMAASYLFLRPAVAAGLRHHIADRALMERILAPYAQGCRFALRGGAGGAWRCQRRPATRPTRGSRAWGQSTDFRFTCAAARIPMLRAAGATWSGRSKEICRKTDHSKPRGCFGNCLPLRSDPFIKAAAHPVIAMG